MNKYNFFKKIYLSFSSISFYQDIIHERMSKTIGYLVLLILILSLPFSIMSGIEVNNELQDIIAFMKTDDFPAFELRDEKLDIHISEPFIYTFDQQKTLKVIVDNTGTYTFNDLAGYQYGYLITPDSVIQTQLGYKPQIINFSMFPGLSLNNEIVIKLAEGTKTMIPIVTSILMILFSIFYGFLRSILSFFLVLIMKNSRRLPIKGSQAYRIGIYTMTVPLMLTTIIQFIPTIIPSSFSFGIFMIIDALIIVNVLKKDQENIS